MKTVNRVFVCIGTAFLLVFYAHGLISSEALPGSVEYAYGWVAHLLHASAQQLSQGPDVQATAEDLAFVEKLIATAEKYQEYFSDEDHESYKLLLAWYGDHSIRAPRVNAPPSQPYINVNPELFNYRDLYLRNLVVTGSLVAPNIINNNTNLVATGTPANIPNTLVLRDGTGSFAAQNITAETIETCSIVSTCTYLLIQVPAASGNTYQLFIQPDESIQPSLELAVNSPVVPDISMELLLHGNSALYARSDSVIEPIFSGMNVEGDPRGDGAVDLQLYRNDTTNVASGNLSSLLGGINNTASGTASAVIGGEFNSATSLGSIVVGGQSNSATGTLAGTLAGLFNNATGNYSTVLGGVASNATGDYSIVLGGLSNIASGIASLAAGRSARAVDDNSFVWADGSTTFTSQGPQTFNVLATGGSFFNSNITTTGSVIFVAPNTNTVTLFPSASTASYPLQLPPNAGTFNYVLTTDGTGITSWAPVSIVGGTGITQLNGLITSTQFFAVGSAGTSLNIVSAGSTHTFNLPLASTLTVTAGTISNIDYTNFQNTYTTVLAATPLDIPNTLVLRDNTGSFVATTVTVTGGVVFISPDNNSVTLLPSSTTVSYLLQLPPNAGAANYVLTTDGSGVTSWQSVSAAGGGGIIDLNGLTTSTQFFANGFAGIQPQFVSLGNTHTLNIPMASSYGVLAGLITSTDYVNFQNTYTTVLAGTSLDIPNTLVKRDGTGSFVATTVTVTGGVVFISSDNNIVTLLPSSTTVSYTLQLPPNAGTANYVLTTDGTGVTSWQPSTGGSGGGSGITQLNGLTTSTQFFANGFAGIQPAFNSAINTHTLSIPMASSYGVLAGLITSTDYFNFENTYTTVLAGTPLNIPNTLVKRDGTGSFAAQNITAATIETCSIVSTCTYLLIQIADAAGVPYQLVLEPDSSVQPSMQLALRSPVPDVSLELILQGSGAFYAWNSTSDETFLLPIVPGDPRGAYAIDLQTVRVDPTCVASGLTSALVGGSNNSATAHASSVFAGTANQAQGIASTIVGGQVNRVDVDGQEGGILAGYQNYVNGLRAVAVGGSNNHAFGEASFAAGTLANAIHDYSFVWADNSIGYNSHGENTFNVHAAGGAFFDSNITTTHAVIFVAPNSNTLTLLPNPATASYTLQFPPNSGTNGYVLTTDGTGVTSWAPGGGGVVTTGTSANIPNTLVLRDGTGSFAAQNITAATIETCSIVSTCTYLLIQIADAAGVPYQLVLEPDSSVQPSMQLALRSPAPDVSLELILQGSGALYVYNKTDDPSFLLPVVTGTTRGAYAVDLQTVRVQPQFVASGVVSALVGGANNLAAGEGSSVLAGAANQVYGLAGTVLGGQVNTVDTGGQEGAVLGGFENYVNALRAVVVGGNSNTVGSGLDSVIVGGQSNSATSVNSSGIFVGNSNTLAGVNSVIAGGISNSITSGSGAGIFAGNSCTITNASNAVVIGGALNSATAFYAATVGGVLNTASGINSYASGFFAQAAHDYSFVWSDRGNESAYQSHGKNTFNIRAAGGSYFDANITTTGAVIFQTSGNAVKLVPASGTSAYTFQLPPNAGTTNYVLTTNGSGVTSWQPVSAIGASGITQLNGLITSTQFFAVGSAGTSFNIVSAGSTHTFNIPLASTLTVTAGLLSNTDYTNFNNTYTTVLAGTPLDVPNTLVKRDSTGSFVATNITATGSVKFVATNSNVVTMQPSASTNNYTFQLPANTGTNNYVLATDGTGVTSWQPVSAVSTGIIQLNGLTTSTQFFANGFAGVQPQFVSSVNTHTLNIPLASTFGVLAGLITSTDYYNFSSKITTITGDTGFVTGSAVSIKGNATAGATVNFRGSGTAMTFNVADSNGNIALGTNAGNGNFLANGVARTTALGTNALNALTTGTSNTAVGWNAGASITTGNNNTYIGSQAGLSTTSGSGNVALGANALLASISTTSAISIGAATTASNNSIAIGAGVTTASISAVALGYGSRAVGASAVAIGQGSSTSGNSSVALGQNSSASTNGVAIGAGATAPGQYNIAIGYNSGSLNASGMLNITMGVQAGDAITTGSQNVLIGNIVGAALSSGWNNIYIGPRVGNSASGSENNVTRIGLPSTQTACYIGGIAGNSVGNTTYVTINPANGQLGTAAATSLDIPNTLVLRDVNGSFAATTVTVTGGIAFQAPNGNTVNMVPNSLTTSYTFQLPINAGTNNYVLTTNGTGITSWQSAAALVTGTSADIPNTLVLRDGNGSFAATTVTVTGGVVFQASNGNTVSMVPNSLTTSYTFQLPPNPGANNYVLTTNGAGVTSWQQTSSVLGYGCTLFVDTTNQAVGMGVCNPATYSYGTVIETLGTATWFGANGGFLTPSANGVLSGAGSSFSLSVSGSRAYIFGGLGTSYIQAFDTQECLMSSVYTTSSLATDNGPLQAATIGGVPYLFAASSTGAGALIRFNLVTNPFTPDLYTILSTFAPVSIAVANNLVYTVNAGFSKFTIYNSIWQLQGSTSSGLTTPIKVQVAGNTAFIIDVGSSTLRSYNVTNPNTPTALTSTAIGAVPVDMVISNSRAYITSQTAPGTNSLKIYDVSNPAVSMPLLGTKTLNIGNVGPLAVSGNFAIVSINSVPTISGGTSTGALYLIDTTNPSNMPIKTIDAGYEYTVQQLALNNNNLYAVGGSSASGNPNFLFAYNLQPSFALTVTGNVMVQGSIDIVPSAVPSAGGCYGQLKIAGTPVLRTSNDQTGIFVGQNAGSGTPLTASYNVAVGPGSMQGAIAGSGNTVVGALTQNTQGISINGTVVVGYLAQAPATSAIAIGNQAAAGGTSAIALGVNSNQATTAGVSSIAVGNTAKAAGASGIALGFTSLASTTSAVAIGAGTSASGSASVSLGAGASSTVANAIAIGNSAGSSGVSSIAVGNGAATTGASGIAIGASALAPNTSSVAIGTSANGAGTSGIAIGNTAKVDAISTNAIAIGTNTNIAITSGNSSIALGTNAKSSGASGTAIGAGSVASNTSSLAIGTSASVVSASGVAIGNMADVDGNGTTGVAIGNFARSWGAQAIAVGLNALANASQAIAIGANTNSTVGIAGASSIAFGNAAQAGSASGIAIGNAAQAGLQSVSIGALSTVLSNSAVGIGYQAQAGLQSISIGALSTVPNSSAVGIGYQAQAGLQSISIGAQSTVTNSSAVGVGYRTQAFTQATTLGYQTTATTSSVALGYQSSASASSSIAMGNTAVATGANDIVIGTGAFSGPGVGLAVGSIAIGSGARGLGTSVAIGLNALRQSNSSSGGNVAIGQSAALQMTSGTGNLALGANSAPQLTTGVNNTVLGNFSGSTVTTGNNNTFIGNNSSGNVTTGSNNIVIGTGFNSGVAAGGSNLLLLGSGLINMLGNPGTTYMTGVFFGINGGGSAPIYINNTGQLGTAASSRKFKENIKDIGSESSAIMQLRPVSFKFKNDSDDYKNYGLIAEEVYEVMPELVLLDDHKEPWNVSYQHLHALMLNEMQKHHKFILDLQQQNSDMAQRIGELEAQLAKK